MYGHWNFLACDKGNSFVSYLSSLSSNHVPSCHGASEVHRALKCCFVGELCCKSGKILST